MSVVASRERNRRAAGRWQDHRRPAGQHLLAGFLVLAIALAAVAVLPRPAATATDAGPDAAIERIVGSTTDVTAEDITQSGPPQTMTAAIRTFVERGYGAETYAGPCDNAVSPRDLWKRCTRLIAETDSRMAFLIGPTFSEFDRWVFLERAPDGAWRVTGSAALDFGSHTLTIPWP